MSTLISADNLGRDNVTQGEFKGYIEQFRQYVEDGLGTDSDTIASNIVYDNTISGLTSDNIKSAIDEAVDINSLTEKVAPIDGDFIEITDSEDSFSRKKVDLVNLKGGANNLPSIIGTATFTNSTNNISISGLTNQQMIDLAQIEIGDVLQISNALNSENNTEYTAEVLTSKWQNGESITIGDKRKSVSTNVTYEATSTGTTSGTDIQDDTGITWQIATTEDIVVNQAHAGKSRTVSPIGKKALIDETSTPNVSIKILSKWYNASDTIGRDYVEMISVRTSGADYTNNTGRPYKAIISVYHSGSNLQMEYLIDGEVRGDTRNGATNIGQSSITTLTIPDGGVLRLEKTSGNPIITNWGEIR